MSRPDQPHEGAARRPAPPGERHPSPDRPAPPGPWSGRLDRHGAHEAPRPGDGHEPGSGHEPEGGGRDGGNEPDVVLDAPMVKVGEIDLEVDDLCAKISLQAEVLDLVKLNVGADVRLDRVKVTIRDAETQTRLKVHLDNVVRILERVFQTLDDHPEIVGDLTRARTAAQHPGEEPSARAGSGRTAPGGQGARGGGENAGRDGRGTGHAGQGPRGTDEGAGRGPRRTAHDQGQDQDQDQGRGPRAAGQGRDAGRHRPEAPDSPTGPERERPPSHPERGGDRARRAGYEAGRTGHDQPRPAEPGDPTGRRPDERDRRDAGRAPRPAPHEGPGEDRHENRHEGRDDSRHATRHGGPHEHGHGGGHDHNPLHLAAELGRKSVETGRRLLNHDRHDDHHREPGGHHRESLKTHLVLAVGRKSLRTGRRWIGRVGTSAGDRLRHWAEED
ncbi:hypothetical protein [Bailinhaonella thermotolerans]|uniref:hypothetical protein n=1 Tax=Bailinhaonella thermotolerans TaxID=1070861 RepID=UPI00192A3E13|nr:hypothetical protein [Bailinhaonella thermotolerans]